MYSLANFTLKDMTALGATLRGLGQGAHSMEEAANKVVRYMYEGFADPQSGEHACTLVRLFKTHSYGQLDTELQQFARGVLSVPSMPEDVKCLTLLASAGDKPEWYDRHVSAGHKAIPLPSVDLVERFPMISQLIHQFGLDTQSVIKPNPKLILDMAQTSFNVFLIAQAEGSPYITAQQDFVIPFGVKSVVGFGGVLPSGDLFAIIMFPKVPISQETANMFKTLALNIKVALLPFMDRIFA